MKNNKFKPSLISRPKDGILKTQTASLAYCIRAFLVWFKWIPYWVKNSLIIQFLRFIRKHLIINATFVGPHYSNDGFDHRAFNLLQIQFTCVLVMRSPLFNVKARSFNLAQLWVNCGKALHAHHSQEGLQITTDVEKKEIKL
ncbi:MAG: hypothetical protein RBG13Loki_3179 [Promethearchaeota archaeon CR_4]|nr:MAG: hypothetical protein RBG13Loki_3179 [Candidatus Lokiarchaeota archaeon CR_4]